MNKADTAIIVPTYNEADNVDELISQLLGLPANLSVVIVDDNSPDGTGKIADEWSNRQPDRIHVVHRPGKLGLGTAYIAGFRLSMDELNAQRIMTMDADFSHNPRYIPSLIASSESNDVVIGSRYVPGGGTLNCTWKRIWLSKIANFVARSSLGLEASDTTAGFRLYHRRVLQSIPLEQIFSNGYSFLVEMLFMCQRRGWQIGEVPIIFEDRRKGTTKISRNEVLKAQYTIMRLVSRRLLTPTRRSAVVPGQGYG